jgi:hypothetical protein
MSIIKKMLLWLMNLGFGGGGTVVTGSRTTFSFDSTIFGSENLSSVVSNKASLNSSINGSAAIDSRIGNSLNLSSPINQSFNG